MTKTNNPVENDKQKTKKQLEIKRNFYKYAPVFITGTIALAVIVIFVLMSGVIKKEIEQYDIENEKVYLAIGEGEPIEYDSKITLDNSSSVTKLEIDGKEDMVLSTYPIYYANSKKVIFPKKMSLVFPMTGGQQSKLNYYTRLTAYDDELVFENTNLKKSVTGGFIYDGYDLYFLLEETKITFDDKEIVVPAFSYVSCTYNEDLFVYNYETKEMHHFKNLESKVTATTEQYKINMSVDSFTVGEKSHLLIKKIDQLSLYK